MVVASLVIAGSITGLVLIGAVLRVFLDDGRRRAAILEVHAQGLLGYVGQWLLSAARTYPTVESASPRQHASGSHRLAQATQRFRVEIGLLPDDEPGAVARAVDDFVVAIRKSGGTIRQLATRVSDPTSLPLSGASLVYIFDLEAVEAVANATAATIAASHPTSVRRIGRASNVQGATA